MKIKTLNLVAFGKFHNRIIEVSEGFNLIFGGNEAGKSTIQHFIEGMLFGFYKPYRKKRTYNEDYYRFKPRQEETYFGAMVVEEDSGKEIRIERDFLKARDGVRIFDNLTGEDISETYPYDSVTRQYMPLGYGGFNAVLYNNTVNVKQMASQSESDLAKEVNDRLVEMCGGSDDDISVTQVIDFLGRKREAVGSFGKSKSNYGMAVRELHNLEGILSESEEVYDQIRKNQKRIQQYKKKIEQAQSKCAEYDKQMEAQNRQEQEDMQRRIEAIQGEGEELRNRLKVLAAYENMDSRVFAKLQILKNSMESAVPRIATLRRELERLTEKRSEIDKRCRRFEENLNGYTEEQIEGDYADYQRAMNQKVPLSSRAEEPEVIEPKTQSSPKEKKHSDTVHFSHLSNVPLIAGMVLGLLVVVFTVVNPGGILPFAALVILSFLGLCLGVGSAVVMGLKNQEAQMSKEAESEEYATFEKAYEDLPMEEEEDDWYDDDQWSEDWDHWEDEEEPLDQSSQEELAELAQSAQSIMEKYGVYDGAAYEAFVKRCREVFGRYNKLMAESARLGQHMEEITAEKESLEAEQKGFSDTIEKALAQAGVSSIEAYGEGCENRTEIDHLQGELAANERLLSELTRVDYRPARSKGLGDNPVLMTDASGEQIRVNQAVEAFNHEMARIQGENAALMSGVGNPVEIKERIETLHNEIQDYEGEIRACDMAEGFFQHYAKKTHYDKAPDLNVKIGEILRDITHKYNEVRVDDQLQIRVVNPTTGELLSMNQLSGGTVDQIYLSLRFGISDLLDSEARMPLILDDPFVQYDDQRKAEAIKYLSALSTRNQVLLFTCSGDEKRIMDENSFSYVGIGV